MEDRKAVARRVLQGQEAAREKNLLSGAHFAENNRKKMWQTLHHSTKNTYFCHTIPTT